jgi:hypothetical protein
MADELACREQGGDAGLEGADLDDYVSSCVAASQSNEYETSEDYYEDSTTVQDDEPYQGDSYEEQSYDEPSYDEQNYYNDADYAVEDDSATTEYSEE